MIYIFESTTLRHGKPHRRAGLCVADDPETAALNLLQAGANDALIYQRSKVRGWAPVLVWPPVAVLQAKIDEAVIQEMLTGMLA